MSNIVAIVGRPNAEISPFLIALQKLGRLSPDEI